MIADLNEPCFYERIFPLTRNTFRYRYVHYQELAAGKYVCDGGAERLVQEWRYKKWEMSQHSKGIPQERRPQDAMENIAYNAGSSRFVYHPVPGINMWEVNCYIRPLAPNESDGSGDLNEWNLFDSFLYPKPAVKSEQGYFSDRHCLSKVLREWRDAKVCSPPVAYSISVLLSLCQTLSISGNRIVSPYKPSLMPCYAPLKHIARQYSTDVLQQVSCQPLPILSEEENFSRTHPRNKAMRGVLRLSRLPPMII